MLVEAEKTRSGSGGARGLRDGLGVGRVDTGRDIGDGGTRVVAADALVDGESVLSAVTNSGGKSGVGADSVGDS